MCIVQITITKLILYNKRQVDIAMFQYYNRSMVEPQFAKLIVTREERQF